MKNFIIQFCKKVEEKNSTEYVWNVLECLFEFQLYPNKIISSYYHQKVVPHKIEVFKAGLLLQHEIQEISFVEWIEQLLIHDLSKFSIQEQDYAFIDFKKMKAGDELEKARFQKAWHHHKHNNKHHPEYWFEVKKDGSTEMMFMPRRYIVEMVADWVGAGKVYGNTLENWLPNNLPEFRLHPDSWVILQQILVLNFGIEIQESTTTKGKFLFKKNCGKNER